MLAGFGKVEITPPLCIPYLSFSPRQTPFAGVHDPLHARALVLTEGEVSLAMLAVEALGFSNDVLGPDRNFTQEVRERVARRTGIPPAQILLASSHIHSAPQTTNLARLLDFPEAGPWLETLMEQLVSAVALAHRSLRPAELRAGIGTAPGIAYNRRRHLAADAPVDDSLAALWIRGEGWCGCLTNFACHPVTVQVNPLVSADYVGAACHLVEEVLDTEACLFLQGACGDLDPVRGTTDFADVRRYGQMLGGQLLHLLARLDAPDWPPLAPGLAVHSRIVTLPGYQYPPEEPYAADVDRLTTALAEAGETERPGIAAALQVARDRLAMVRRGSVPVPAEVQALRLGDTVAVVSVPGELFCRLGLEIKRRSPAPITLVSGYTNGYEGYFPTAAAFSEGGYEPSVGPWCRVGPTAGELLVETAVSLLQELWGNIR
ncbi:MAG: hypothetical protein GX774_20880 [Armatimonadetes bacterium]|jgi:neutral ceramidase|nr:hypothetical protein [Armatimonadota bacterium]